MIEAIIQKRSALDDYIRLHPNFKENLTPLPEDKSAPEIARRMMEASRLTGLGPMAAVAGAFSQSAVDAALAGGAREAVAENGGDIVLKLQEEMILGIHPGKGPLQGKLAFLVSPKDTPLSICSSSSKMGHSLSFGNCDLATVVGKDGFITDAVATLGANLVKKHEDMNPVIERLLTIPGILGILLVFDGKIGLGGSLPEIIKNNDPRMEGKITRAPFAPQE